MDAPVELNLHIAAASNAGLSAREIANFLKHEHASRHIVSQRAADLLVLAR